jgi:ABC-type glycerol-3-phosphate transport system permease component
MVHGSNLHETFGKVLVYVFLMTMTLIWLVPIAMMLIVSFMPPDQRAPQFGGLLIKSVSLFNYRMVYNDAPILRYFLNSVLITFPSVLLVVVLASLAAFAFARLRFFFKEFWYYLLITTLMLPIPTLIIPIFLINKSLHIYNHYLGLIFPYTALGIPFAIIVLRSFFSGFPKDIEDAARIDGCSPFGILWRIILPSSWPALSVVIIWQFMISWNEFILALVTIESNEIKPLTLVPLIYSGQFMARPGAMFAILTLITVPIVMVYLFMQRYFVSTATGGAIKG